jgi:hypothetical protein
MLNESLEDVPRCHLLNFVEQLRKFVKCDHPNVHLRTKKRTSFLINGLQQPGVTPGIGYASRSSFVDLLEDSKVMTLPKYNLPVCKMGDYQSFLINQKVLRPIEEDTSLQKANIFGSPYRLKKMQDRHKLMKNMGSVDEILHLDESSPSSPVLKRKMNEEEFPSGKRRKYDFYSNSDQEQDPFSINESSPDLHALLSTHHSHVGTHVLEDISRVSEKQPIYVSRQQILIRNYNIRRLFVNNFLRVSIGDSMVKVGANIKVLVEKVSSQERNELITILIKEALSYKNSKIVQILTDLMI